MRQYSIVYLRYNEYHLQSSTYARLTDWSGPSNSLGAWCISIGSTPAK